MYVHMYTYVCMYTIFIHYLYACLFIFLYCSLYDAYSDEMGTIDFSRSQNGSGMASQSQVYTYICMDLAIFLEIHKCYKYFH